jgi:hypothetical protein
MANLDDSLAARGLLNPVTVVDQAEGRLQGLRPDARSAFAVLCAQRLMDAHLQLPHSEQRPFTLSWAPVLQEIWAGLNDPNDLSAKSNVERHLNAFYGGPFNHNLGEDGPDDADDDAAAGSIYAAQAFCRGDVKPARWAASRLIDSTDKPIQKARTGLPRNTLEEFAHPLSQREARGLLRALDLLESQPWAPELIPKLRASFDQDTI